MPAFQRSLLNKTRSPFLLFLLALICSNVHLLGAAESFNPLKHCIARPQLLEQWWRIFTHPFVHVSWPHLLLDASAVCLLWQFLPKGFFCRVGTFFFCAMTSLLCALLLSPHINQTGLCGLSGAAHGMATCAGACWMWTNQTSELHSTPVNKSIFHKALGATLLTVVTIKSVLETVLGSGVFTSLYHGTLGVVIVHAHLGGALGGIIFAILISFLQRDKQQ